MKKNLKLLLLIVTSMVLAYGMSSCSSSDGYKYDVRGSLAKVHIDSDGYAKSFTLDNGQTLLVNSTSTAYKPKYERVVINYTILEKNINGYDYAIRLNGYFEDVLTKPIIYIPADNQHLQDSIGYNKIKVFSMWGKADYINVRFGYNTAGRGQHMLNLVSSNDDLVQVGDEPIKLEFRHKMIDDQENYASGKFHVSFKLDEYIKANRGNENLAFEVSWREYDGTEKKEIIKYPLSPAVVNPPEVEIE